MTTELWWGEPHRYMQEISEVGHYNYAWSMGAVLKYGIDPVVFLDLHCGGLPWRALVIAVEGTKEYVRGQSKPIGVYPTWVYGRDDISLLIDWIERPVSEDDDMVNDRDVLPEWRPIPGQPHRVVIDGCPNVRTVVGKRFINLLEDLQGAHPECIVHLHRPDGFRAPFGHNIASADLDIKFLHFGTKTLLANGTDIRPRDGFASLRRGQAKWLHLVGFTAGDLDNTRNRLLCSMKSALWAATNYSSVVDFRVTGRNIGDPGVAVIAPETAQRQRVLGHRDKMICDTCTIRLSCKYYREGMVCGVPGSDGSKLAQFFQTRDSGRIIDGMAALQAINAERLERALGDEAESDDGLNPEVTKIIQNMMAAAEKQAKLVDPRLAAAQSHRVAIGIINHGVASTSIETSSPSQLAAVAVAELEAAGTDRADITPEMVHHQLVSTGRVIEATASESQHADVG